MRLWRAGLIVAVVATMVPALGGCSRSAKPSSADMSPVWGYVASSSDTHLDVSANQNGVEQLTIKRVTSPSDAWLVVEADVNGKPGDQVAVAFVKRGESLNRTLSLTDLKTPKLFVTLYADRGVLGTFEYDPLSKTTSPDRPYFVNGKELTALVTVRQYGVSVSASQVSIVASDQIDATGTLTVSRVLAPGPSWVVAHLATDSGQGQRIGLLHVNSGETTGAIVPLDPLPLGKKLILSLYADRGDPGLFNFDPADLLNSVDQPYFIKGREYTVSVRVR